MNAAAKTMVDRLARDLQQAISTVEEATRFFEDRTRSMDLSSKEIRAPVSKTPGPQRMLQDIYEASRAKDMVSTQQKALSRACYQLGVAFQEWQVLAALSQGRADLLTMNMRRVFNELAALSEESRANKRTKVRAVS